MRGPARKRLMWTTLAVLLGVIVVFKLISFTGSAPQRADGVRSLPDCPSSPNCVCSTDGDADHRIAPLNYSDAPSAAWARLVEVVQQQGGKLVAGEDEHYARFEFRSLVFRFVDDVEILNHPEQSRIEIRSASRSGYSDFGANRRRVERIRQAFAEVSPPPKSRE